ncbi:hypothetical protein [Exiguobacterium sp. NG55]|uniref:hypothetical protein n=1 Tax=Exiguobacterium sp. NG55 TaxID=375477 RepID=UPI0004DF187F|nr:hypothetical protein [Exiguobacterium sp. NG55]
MKDYIYVDFDFIQSYLAQAGKGLSQSTIYSKSTMKEGGERTGNAEQVGGSGGEVKTNSSHEINLQIVKSTTGGDISFKIDMNNLVYLFEKWKSKSEVSKEAMSIELHDYAIELFEESFTFDKSATHRFIKNTTLEFIQMSSDYKKDVKAITDLLKSEFMIAQDIPNLSSLSPNEKKKRFKQVSDKLDETMKLEQSDLILRALTSIIPSPVSLSFSEGKTFYIGALNEINLRMNISEILFSYGNKTPLTVIGIVSRELKSRDNEYNQLNMYSQLRVDFMSTIKDFYKDSTEKVMIFKPILVYRVI